MDTVFRILNASTTSETYLLEDWGAARKTSMVADWVHDLKNGITIGSNNDPACYYDLDNLTWSGRAMSNSDTPAL